MTSIPSRGGTWWTTFSLGTSTKCSTADFLDTCNATAAADYDKYHYQGDFCKTSQGSRENSILSGKRKDLVFSQVKL